MHAGPRLLQRLQERVGRLGGVLGKGDVRLREDHERRLRLEGRVLREGEDLLAELLDLDVPLALVARPKGAHVRVAALGDAPPDALGAVEHVLRQRDRGALLADAARPLEEIGRRDSIVRRRPLQDADRRRLRLDALEPAHVTPPAAPARRGRPR